MAKSIKHILRQVHLYVALTLGLYLAVISLTGSALVFKQQLAGWLHPEWHHVAPDGDRLPLDKLLAAYTASRPDANVTWMILPQRPDQTLCLWDGPIGWHQSRIFIDPYHATILADHPYTGTWLNWIEYLHIALLTGGPDGIGIKINAWLGFASVLLLLTGLVLWWPRRLSQRRPRLVVKWRARWPRVNWDLHHALGIWTLPALLALCLSGAAFAFPSQIKTTVRWFTAAQAAAPPHTGKAARQQVAPEPATRAAPTHRSQPAPLTLDRLVARSVASVPGSKAAMVMQPAAKAHPLYVFVHPPDDHAEQWWISVAVDRSTGKILSVKRPMDSPPDAAMAMMFPIHAGTFGGLPLKIAWFLVGLVPAALLVTGVGMWSKRGWRMWR